MIVKMLDRMIQNQKIYQPSIAGIIYIEQLLYKFSNEPIPYRKRIKLSNSNLIQHKNSKNYTEK